jgi:hypothetical protein
MDTRIGRTFNGIPAIIDGLEIGMGQDADRGLAYFLRDKPDSLKITGRGNGKAGFDNVNAELFELTGDFQLFLNVESAPRRLFPVP